MLAGRISSVQVALRSGAGAEAARSALQSVADKAEAALAQEEVSNDEPGKTTLAAPADDTARSEGMDATQMDSTRTGEEIEHTTVYGRVQDGGREAGSPWQDTATGSRGASILTGGGGQGARRAHGENMYMDPRGATDSTSHERCRGTNQ